MIGLVAGQVIEYGTIITPLLSVTDGATVLGTAFAAMAAAYKGGKLVQERQNEREDIKDEQDELKEAHFNVHEDIEQVINVLHDMNGHDLKSNRSECNTCDDVEERMNAD